jgi:hypothetical protein
MILVAGGDSFVWGLELADCAHSGPNGYSQKTFPALLAQGMDYHCVAYPGNANSAISRSVMTACEILKDVAVLVNWTFPQRYDFRFNYDTLKETSPWYSIHSHYPTDEPLDNISNSDLVKDFARTFYKHVGNNEYYELYSTLKEILFLQLYLKSKNIPYLFTTADNSYYDHENYLRSKDTELESLYNQVTWNNWYFFEKGTEANETLAPRGFYQWAVENKYKVGIGGHPLEQAHSDAAALIKEKFDELVTKYI